MRYFFQILAVCLSVISMIYGTSVKGIGSGSKFFLVWYAIALFFGGVFCILHFDLWMRIPRGWRVAGLSVVICGLVYVIVMSALIMSHANDRGEEDLDVLIVLGAQVTKTGPSRILYYRLETAYDYLTKNPRTICIVSGGQGGNEPQPEGTAMKEYLVEKGIAPERIITETESENTTANIKNCLVLCRPESDRVGILTNDFHLLRGLSIAQKQGFRQVTGIAAPSNPVMRVHNVLRECVGILKDKVMGNL